MAVGRDYLTQALAICRALDSQKGILRCLTDLGALTMNTGNYAEARSIFQTALHLAREHGIRMYAGLMHWALGVLALDEADYAAARQLLEYAHAVFHELGILNFAALITTYQGRLAAALGDYPTAHALAQQSLHTSRQLHAREPELESLLLMALVAHLRHSYPEALAYAETACRIATQMGERSFRARAWLGVGRGHEGLGQWAAATEAYQSALDLFTALDKPHLAVEAQAGLARLALATGDLALARAHVEAILAYLAQRPLAGPDEPARILFTCYHVLSRLDDPRAPALLDTANGVLHKHAAPSAEPSSHPSSSINGAVNGAPQPRTLRVSR
jgi:tetratricopeptide (TPR) repeat protein